MNIQSLLFFSVLFFQSAQGTSNWSNSSNNTIKDKQNINFYGSLKTQQGQEYSIRNITVGGKDHDILLYEKPKEDMYVQSNEPSKNKEIRLKSNPNSDFVKTKIDLSQIVSLRVDPSTIWFYQKEKKHQKQEFLAVEITMKGSSTSQPYLMEYRIHISCESNDENGSQKKDVPLAAVDQLTIGGYAITVTSNKKGTEPDVATQCPIIKKETETKTEVLVNE